MQCGRCLQDGVGFEVVFFLHSESYGEGGHLLSEREVRALAAARRGTSGL